MATSLLGRGRDFISSRLYPRAVAAWDSFGRRVRSSASPDPDFDRRGWRCGLLSESSVRQLSAALEAAVPETFRTRAVKWSYFYPPGSDEKRLNEANVFYRLGATQLRAFAAVLEEIGPDISRAMGSPWRVVNVRYWTTRKTANPYGGNAWHRDGMPESILKVMVYPDGASETLGTTELIDATGTEHRVEGPAGTWLLFQNSVLEHRGVPSETGGRRILEFTIAPAMQTSFRPIAAGNNAQYPFVPWLR